ncbi:MgtC/SapB family protein [Novosphingobium sp.]|uniref:MgtC/SapB family protein n=1 Tax=Novosphingobium sp. TaxID=1874826 RepID=UPI0027356D9F|nr:MgtC/SapB family protein [Novosphingobium sp.]MDP3906375.1 MgtC/SapB family protein [Novosphingobium sp.]
MEIATLLDDPAPAALGLALALGLLVGIQRGWALRASQDGKRFAGIRTFGLIGLAGGIAGTLQARAEGLATVLLAATAALVVIGYWRSTQRGPSVSGTASMVGLLTMAFGFVAGSGNFALASAATGVMVLVLAMRHQLHDWVAALDEGEMLAIARFALIALVILPLLPNTPFGPYDAWRPRELWLVVVLVCGFSLAGYVAAKRLGASQATLATAAAGSMVSSTAVTAALAGRLRSGDGDAAVLNAGVALASAVMFARVIVLTGALAGFALPMLMLWAVPGMVVSLIGTAVLIRRRQDGAGSGNVAPSLRNPFAIKPALVLMVLVMVLSAVSHWVLERYGNAGLATVLALSGMVDVDSAIITMGHLPVGALAPHTAALVLMPPILLNTLFKAGAALGMAGWHRAWPGAAVLAASCIAALGTLPLLL